MTSGKMKAFQYRWNVKIASTASAGRESGTMMWRYTCHSEAPSTRAACSSSVGSVWMNCFMRKTPKTSASPGRMTPGHVWGRARRRRTWTGRRLLILDIGPQRAELRDRDDDGHHEEHDRHGAREAVAAELERGAVDELHDRDRRVVRAAAVRHDVHAFEDLEREDRVHDHQVERRRPQQRHGDVPPLREGPGPLEIGRLVELARQRPDRRRVEDHAATGDREDRAQDHREGHVVGAADPEERAEAERAGRLRREPAPM